jgi:hypothetical protein
MREESLYAWVRKNRKNDLGVRNDEVKIGKVLIPVRKSKGKNQ